MGKQGGVREGYGTHDTIGFEVVYGNGVVKNGRVGDCPPNFVILRATDLTDDTS